MADKTEYPYQGYCIDCGARHEVGADIPDAGCMCGGDIIPRSGFVGPLADLFQVAEGYGHGDPAALLEVIAKDAAFSRETIGAAMDTAAARLEQNAENDTDGLGGDGQ